MKGKMIALVLVSALLVTTSCSSKAAKMDAMLNELELIVTEMVEAVNSQDTVKMLKVEDKLTKSKLANFDLEAAFESPDYTTEQKIRLYEILSSVSEIE